MSAYVRPSTPKTVADVDAPYQELSPLPTSLSPGVLPSVSWYLTDGRVEEAQDRHVHAIVLLQGDGLAHDGLRLDVAPKHRFCFGQSLAACCSQSRPSWPASRGLPCHDVASGRRVNSAP